MTTETRLTDAELRTEAELDALDALEAPYDEYDYDYEELDDDTDYEPVDDDYDYAAEADARADFEAGWRD